MTAFLRLPRPALPDGSLSSAADTDADLPTWDLSDLYSAQSADEKDGGFAGRAAALADIEAARAQAEAFAASYEGRVADSLSHDGDVEAGARLLARAMADYEALDERMGRIASFAGLIYATDTSKPAYAKFYGDVQEKLTAISSRILFFTLDLNRLEDDALEAAYGTSEALARYRPWLVNARAWRPYQLNDDLEKLLLEKRVTGAAAWNRLFDETMAGLRFDIDGKPLAIEPALNLLADADPERRATGARALATTFEKSISTFTLITNTLAKDKETEDRWRGYTDVAQARHLSNQVEPEVVNALAAAVEQKFADVSHRYYGLKARMLGVETLNYWDRNAPLPDADTSKLNWDTARDTVLKAYRGFSPDLAAIGEKFFGTGWIDAQIRPGKAPGAFAHPTVPSAHPYLLLNYQGKLRDVMTLAHELGHGVHQVLAAPQGQLLSQTPLTLAETASVFGEMLTFRALLADAPDKTAHRAMLASKVEDMINTVVRQTAFYMFEREVHLSRREGELTSDDIGRIWMDVQAKSLGPAVTLNEGYENFWCYIPHFIHSPFYVYAYAFGDCLVNSLYRVYQDGHPDFASAYLNMLRAGGTKHHSELLAPFGLDARDPAFWAGGLAVIEGLIDELEGLVA
ncbi:M3 family oligoendopeptidase [Pyruvatibacter sp.]|uniref:M3 family oligoendopeptidase n=1 Tax=Pyruvatibacter sp. TaxID=1981328 RepID=UPI0032EC8EF1